MSNVRSHKRPESPSATHGMSPSSAPAVFISYSHADERWLDQLLLHLRPLRRSNQIDIWSDRRLDAGDDWRNAIEEAIHNAAIAILLVSPRFLASEFIAKNELPPLLERARTRSLRVVPLLVAPSRFEVTPELNRYQAANSPGRELSRLRGPDRDSIFVKLSVNIEGALTLSDRPGKMQKQSLDKRFSTDVMMSMFSKSGGGSFVRCLSAKKAARSDPIDPNLRVLGDPSHQWVVIVATCPAWLNIGFGTSVEEMDATRLLDRFSSPEFDGLSSERVIFITGHQATASFVRESLDAIAKEITEADSVLFFYSGHTTEGLLALYDFSQLLPREGQQRSGSIPAKEIVEWVNALSARQVTIVMDGGGSALYDAARYARPNRYALSALESRFVFPTGILTWYFCRAIAEFGAKLKMIDLLDILLSADNLYQRRMRFYARGKPSVDSAT